MTEPDRTDCEIVTVERRPVAIVREMVPFAEIPAAQRRIRPQLSAALRELGFPAAATLTLWRPPVDGRLDLAPGVFVPGVFEPVGEVRPSELPAGRAARLILTGPFDGIPGGWERLFACVAARGLKPAGVNWEIYGDYQQDQSRQATELFALLA